MFMGFMFMCPCSCMAKPDNMCCASTLGSVYTHSLACAHLNMMECMLGHIGHSQVGVTLHLPLLSISSRAAA